MSKKHGQLEAIFNAALEFTGPERELYLARACGDDTSLRQRVPWPWLGNCPVNCRRRLVPRPFLGDIWRATIRRVRSRAVLAWPGARFDMNWLPG